MNGVAGLRPSFGCYNAADGIVPMTTSRDTAGERSAHPTWHPQPLTGSQLTSEVQSTKHMLCSGFMARSVEDIQLFNSILSDCDSQYQEVSLKGLRLGYPVDRWEGLDAEVPPHPPGGCRRI